ncbi:MAG: hypothetical protein ACOYNY_20345 [Caldilineaceae bacterium]|jgi:hypothetical protein
MKSIRQLLSEGDRILSDLITADMDLSTALIDESMARRQLREAEQALNLAEAEIVSEAALQAKAKAGPLAGLAVSSDAYKMAVQLLVAKAHTGNLQRLAGKAKERQIAAEDAKVGLERAQVRFSAIRHASNLLAGMLQAANSVQEGNVTK